MKKILISVILSITILFCSIPAASFAIEANHASTTDMNAQDVVYETIKAVNDHNLTSFINLQCEANKADYETFFRGLDWNKDNDGLMCIETASISEIKELPLAEVTGFTSIDKYENIYDDLSAFYAGINYTVQEESKYYFNGVNYRIIITGKENGQWKIVEISDAPVESLYGTDYSFNSHTEKVALEIISERFQGNIINSKGALLSKNVNVLSDSEHVKPNYIRVYRTSLGKTQNIDLYSYVKNVLPNEWISSWPSESLKTGAMACKMYGWYHHYHPKWSSLNADVKDTTSDQVFKPNTETDATTRAINAVGNVGIENSNGKIFETQYHAGTSGSAGNANSGKISQYGSKYLAESGWTYMMICAYYYNVSDKSPKRIASFIY